MNKKIVKIILVLVVVTLLTGCRLVRKKKTVPTTNPVEVKEKTVSINYKETEAMKKVSELVFNVEKDSLKVDDLSNDDKAGMARSLIASEGKSYTEVTGTEMTNNFKKYFGSNQKIEYNDIKCFLDHGNDEENIMLYFDKDKDMYVYNEKHPGHGGGGNEYIGFYLDYENIEVTGNEYKYEVKILFYGKAVCHDIGGCNYGKGYKTYEDAKNEKNSLLEIDNNNRYTNMSCDFPIVHLDDVFKDYRDKLNTYIFNFKKVNNNLIFVNYEKK